MPPTAPHADADRTRIDLSRSEQWVLHDVVLDRCETARDERRTPPWWAVDVLERLEEGALAVTPFEARRLRTDLREYADRKATPGHEAATARTVVEELERTFEGPRTALRE